MWIATWLFIAVTTINIVHSDRTAFERNVLNVHAYDIVKEGNITFSTIRSIKVAAFYKRVGILRDVSKPDNTDTRSYPMEHIREDHEVERNIMIYFDKVWFLSELADDPKMKTICVIGFDLGYSSMNFLIANPVARVFSLDSYEHDYVSKGDSHSVFLSLTNLVIHFGELQ